MKIEWEYDLAEMPFCEQLKSMGWQWLEGDTDVPYLTERETFREVLLKSRLASVLFTLTWSHSSARRAHLPALHHMPDAQCVQVGAEDMKLALLRLLVPGFRYRLPLLLDQSRQDLSEGKLLCDGLDNVLQLLFATSKGTFAVGHRKGEVEGVIANRVPGEALFQKPEFVGRQNEREVANALSHYSGE